MSRHEGVSCDSCLKNNFHGRRYKCLTCYDYDLCASCYEAGATTTRHTFEHPMQCILTREDFELYYGGEALTNEQSQSFTCPFCGKMGFTETVLQEHVNAEHPDSTVEVVCPICAAHPGGDPNLVTDDFAGHLALEHRPTTRDLISFLDEPAGSRSSVRRIPHSARGVGGSRPRRGNLQFSSSGGISSLSPSGRDAVDPIAELLSQLSIVRRSNPTRSSASAQLQQLQMQLQMERQQVRAARQQLERFPRRQVHASSVTSSSSGTTNTTVTALSNHVLAVSNTAAGTSTPKTSESTANSSGSSIYAQPHSQLMLTKCMDTSLSEAELETLEIERADRSIFIQDALLNTLMKNVDEEKSNGKRTVRERSSPLQTSSSSQSSTTSTQCSSSDRSAKNEQNEHVSNGLSKQSQQQRSTPQRTSPSTDRTSTLRGGSGGGGTTTTAAAAATPFHNRIEYLVPRPLHTAPGTINVGEVLVRNVGSNYTSTDTARRKPICTVDSINQTSEPPTSH